MNVNVEQPYSQLWQWSGARPDLEWPMYRDFHRTIAIAGIF